MLVFIWLFTKIKLGEGVPKLNYVMAFVIAWSMTNSPKTGLNMVIAAGQLVAAWVFFDNLKDTITNPKIRAFAAVVLVTLLTNLAFPGVSGGWTWLAGTFGSLILLAGIFMVVYHFVSKAIAGI